ncbi:MAG: hypothetical protein DRH11_15955 [Deltaproteobacteria bacterium]|nr:MAG: hypothetical protein DRH11_15955 [Deltaproteobacteria bacterium]
MGNDRGVSLVTGGAGFIGSELVRQLLDNGESVVVYDNFSFGRVDNLPDSQRLSVVRGDIRDQDQLFRTFEEYSPEVVYHLAAIHFIPYCIAHPQEAIQVNVEGTLNVFEACKSINVKAVIYASTAAVYPVKDRPHTEEDPPQPIEIYGATKLFGEELLRIFHEETGVKCAAARLFNGYGRRETNPHVIPDILEQIPKGNKIHLGNVEPKRDFIHTSDISRAFRKMAESGEYGYEIFNVGTGIERSVREVVETISKLLERPLEIVIDEERKRKVERMHLVPDISKIKSIIGWSPQVSFEDGFRDMLESVGLL